MKMTLLGMQKSGSTEPQKVITALEEHKGKNSSDFEIRGRNHQTVRPFFVLQTKKEKRNENQYDMVEVVDVSSTEQPKNINMCNDIGTF